MSIVMEAIEKIFAVGCGLEISRVTESTRFAELKSHCQSLPQQYQSDSQESIALRAGNLVMGELLNCFSEDEATERAKNVTPEFGNGLELRPLIQILGESIVAEAANCLPADVLEMTKEWKGATTERQIEIARSLFFLFRSESQGIEKETMTTEKAYQDLWRKSTEKMSRNHRMDDILPRLYGKWNKKCPANCQGKTQMLVAFARLAGAKVMTVGPLRSGYETFQEKRNELAEIINHDLQERHLENVDASFMDSRAGHQILTSTNDEVPDFHVSATMELSDGRWMLIDPHGIAWGVFSDYWKIGRVWQMLQKYNQVLPGLQVIRDDNGETAAKIQVKMNKALSIIERSRVMEKTIREQVGSIMDLIRVINESDDFDLLIRLNAEQEGDCDTGFLEEENLRKFAVIQIVTGGKMWDMHTLMDPQFLKNQIGEWLTFYHAIAINCMGNQMAEAGELVHPTCEFNSNPEYHLAIAAINSVLTRLDNPSQRFLMDHSFDQVTLYNCLLPQNRPEIRKAAAATVRRLPFIHHNIRLRWKNDLF